MIGKSVKKKNSILHLLVWQQKGTLWNSEEIQTYEKHVTKLFVVYYVFSALADHSIYFYYQSAKANDVQ